MAGAAERVEHGIVKLVVAHEILQTAFAEVDDAGLPYPIGIIEDIFETEGVEGEGIFVVVVGIEQLDVVGRHVIHQTEVGIGRHSGISRQRVFALRATAGRRPRGVGAVGLDGAVAAGTEGQQRLLAGIVTPDRERAADGVERQLIPESLDAVTAHVSAEEVGMGEVETYVLHAHHNAAAGVLSREAESLVGGGDVEQQPGGIHQHMLATARLNALHLGTCREGGERTDGQLSDTQRPVMRQQTAAGVGNDTTEVVVGLDEGDDVARRRRHRLSPRHVGPHRLPTSLTDERRHLRPYGQLRVGWKEGCGGEQQQ